MDLFGVEYLLWNCMLWNCFFVKSLLWNRFCGFVSCGIFVVELFAVEYLLWICLLRISFCETFVVESLL